MTGASMPLSGARTLQSLAGSAALVGGVVRRCPATDMQAETETSSEPREDAPPPGAGARAGRGVLWISAAKIVFVLFGFAVQFGLPRVLESPAEFGLLSAAIAFTVILTNAMTSSMVQTTSKLVAEAGGRAIARPLAVRHAGLASILALAVLGAAGLVAERVLSSPALTPLVRLGSVVVVAYAIYSTAIGALNGAHAFERQARLDATFSTVRTLGLLGGGVSLGLALSAMTGFATAALAMASIGALAAGLHRAPEGPVPPLGRHLRVLLPIGLYQLALNGLLQLDIEILVTGTTLAASAGGASEAAASDAGAHAAGLYRVAQTLAFVPYQLVTSVTLVLFPVVAHAASAGQESEARETVRAAVRFSLLFVAGLLTPLAGAASGAVRLAFPSAYEGADVVVPVLALSQLFFAMGVLQATVLIGRGHLWRVVAIATGALALGVLGNVLAWWLAPATLPLGTAWGTTLGSIAFAALTALALHADLRVGLAPSSLVRVALAGGVALVVARLVPGEGRIVGLVALVLAGLAYLAVLAASRELGSADLALVRRVLARGRKPR
jgi:stage V sporulation protein B